MTYPFLRQPVMPRQDMARLCSDHPGHSDGAVVLAVGQVPMVLQLSSRRLRAY
jgi:hypothetical protein